MVALHGRKCTSLSLHILYTKRVKDVKGGEVLAKIEYQITF